MKKEVTSAVDFLTQLMRPSAKNNTDSLDSFNDNLKLRITEHYKDHWFPEKPFKGSGFRCLRINHQIEPVILKAAAESGLTKEDLLSMLPNDLTLWIDPREVSYRIGEDGSVGVLYEDDAKPVKPAVSSRSGSPAEPAHPAHNVNMVNPLVQNRVSPVPMPAYHPQMSHRTSPQPQRTSPVQHHHRTSPVPMGSPVRTSPVPRYLQCSPTRPSSSSSSLSGDYGWDLFNDQGISSARYQQLAQHFQHQLSQPQHHQQHNQRMNQQQCSREALFKQANLNDVYDLKRLAAYVYS